MLNDGFFCCSVKFMSELHHISDFDFDRYHSGAMRSVEMSMIYEHLLWCRYCVAREGIIMGGGDQEKGGMTCGTPR
jgi:hypothetical protein